MLAPVTLGVIVLVGLLLYGAVRFFARFPQLTLRSPAGSDTLSQMTAPGQDPPHITLGNANLIGQNSQSTVAGWQLMRHMIQAGMSHRSPPTVTLGEATQLPLVQATVRQAHRVAGLRPPPVLSTGQFVAAEGNAVTYAAATAAVLQRTPAAGSVVAGQVGAEVAFMSDAAVRRDVPQVVATDDVQGAAVAFAFTPDVLVGEELLTAPSFLAPRQDRSAALIVMDVLRWLVAGAITGLVLYQLLAG